MTRNIGVLNELHVTWDGPTIVGVVSSPGWTFDLLP